MNTSTRLRRLFPNQLHPRLCNLDQIAKADPKSQIADRLNEAVVALWDNRCDVAHAILQELQVRAPDDPEVWRVLACYYAKVRDYEKAKEYTEIALKMQPYHHDLLTNLGSIEMHFGNLDRAERALEAWLMIENDIRLNPTGIRHYGAWYNYGMLKVRQGDYRGWNGLEYGYYCGKRYLRGVGLPLWRGDAIPGKILFVYSEQGDGDSILHSRFLAQAKKVSQAHVIYECPAHMYPLFQHLPERGVVDEVHPYPSPIAKQDGRQHANSDDIKYVSVMSLISRLKLTRPEDVRCEPYLLRPTDRKRTGKPRLAGLCWRGNPLQEDDNRRSIHDPTVLQILREAPVEWVSLQMDERGERPDFVKEGVQPGWNWGQTADFIYTHCDVTVSVCTSIAHLSGAMGVPVYCMVHTMPYYIWGVSGEKTHWYDTMTLVRQPKPNDWASVLQKVVEKLMNDEL